MRFDSRERHVDSLLHPTDLSRASERAFHHALALAIRYAAQFTLLHAVGRRATDNWPDFPSAHDKLAEWQAAGTTLVLEDRIQRSRISKVAIEIRDPVAASMEYISRNRVDMLVMATEGRRGISRLVRASRAQQLARESRITTLFIPEGGKDFVSGRTGEVTLQRILVPVDPATDPRPSMLGAVHTAALLEDPSIEITLLHVGGDEEASIVDAPELPFCTWKAVRRSGQIVPEILSVAEEIDADAIYMSTTWSKAGFGRVEGGVTEAVLRDAPCPVAAIPV